MNLKYVVKQIRQSEEDTLESWTGPARSVTKVAKCRYSRRKVGPLYSARSSVLACLQLKRTPKTKVERTYTSQQK